MKKQLIIGDAHFGVYNNSTTWFESQMEYFRKDINGIIKENYQELSDIIFLGDVFDIRYSTNNFIGLGVKNYVRDLSILCDGLNKDINIWFLSGNHDYYSPIEENKEYNTYDVVFGQEFEKYYNNLHFVINKFQYIDDEKLILPWYEWNNKERLLDILNNQLKPTTKVIYTHCDIENCDEEVLEILDKNGVSVMSGHIHYPVFIESNKGTHFYSMGSCLPLTFNDVNSYRYVYICDNQDIVKQFKNTRTLQFKRYYNEDIFNLDDSSFENSKTQLCISEKNINQARYIEQLNYLKSMYFDKYQIETQVIDDDTTLVLEDNIMVTNINKYIDENIPQHLKEKYLKVKEIIKSNSEEE